MESPEQCLEPPSIVIPAQAGIQYSAAISGVYWIPACAGMTTMRMALVERT
jgi:hypothetical protein